MEDLSMKEIKKHSQINSIEENHKEQYQRNASTEQNIREHSSMREDLTTSHKSIPENTSWFHPNSNTHIPDHRPNTPMSESRSSPVIAPYPPYPGMMYQPSMPYPPHGYPPYPHYHPHNPHQPSAPNSHDQAVHHEQDNERNEETPNTDHHQSKPSSTVPPPPPAATPYQYPYPGGHYPYYPPPHHPYYNMPYPPVYPTAAMPNPGMMHNNPHGVEDPRYASGSAAGQQQQQNLSNEDNRNQSQNHLERNRLARKKEQNLKEMIKTIVAKDPKDRTEDEIKAYNLFEERRQRKNKRSRERTKEKAREMKRVLSIPENQRTERERVWLEVHLKAKKRKNEGDRRRRERIKMLGQSSSRSSLTSAQSQDLSDFDFLFDSYSGGATSKEKQGGSVREPSPRHSSIFRSQAKDSYPMETVGEQQHHERHQSDEYQQESSSTTITRTKRDRENADTVATREPMKNSRPATPTNAFDNLMNSMNLSPMPHSGQNEDSLPLLSPLTGSHSTSLTSRGASEEHSMDISSSYSSTVPVAAAGNVARSPQHTSRPAKQLLLYSSSVSTIPMGTGVNVNRQRF